MIAVDDVDRVVVGRRPGRFGAPPLIDRDVDEHRRLLHPAEHLAGDELRREGTGDENGADDEIRVLDRLLDLEARRHEQRHTPVEDLLQVAHAVDRALEDGHLHAQPDRDDGGL